MNIVSFLVNYWSDVFLLFLFVLFSITLIRRGGMVMLKNIGLSFVTEAERLYGGGLGTLKKSFVLKLLYDKIPPLLQPLFSEKSLSKLIDNVLLPAAEDYWREHPAMLEYINALRNH